MRRAADFLLPVLLAGCGSGLDRDYAAVNGPSINGAQAFVRMLRADGHSVRAVGKVYRKFRGNVDAIIVFSRSWSFPPEETQLALRDWLEASADRIVVFVPRDTDLEAIYWRKVIENAGSQVDAGQESLLRRSLEAAEAGIQAHSAGVAPGPLGIGLEAAQSIRHCTSLEVGESLRELQLKPGAADMCFHRRLILPATAQVVVRSGGEAKDVAIAEIPVGSSTLIALANGSFTLNGGLVNAESRKLANWISRTIPSEAEVVVVVGDELGESEAAQAQPGVLRFLSQGPMAWLSAQILAMLSLYLFSRFPAFGRPRSVAGPEVLDFGRHIDAIARLLAKSKDRRFAARKIQRYLGASGSGPVAAEFVEMDAPIGKFQAHSANEAGNSDRWKTTTS